MKRKLFYLFALLILSSCEREFPKLLSPGRMIKSFALESGQYGKVSIVSSNDEHQVFVTLQPDANLNSLKPIIEISDDASITPSSGDVIDVSINKTVVYKVTSASGQTRDWQVVFRIHDSQISDYDTYSIASVLNGKVMQVEGDYKFNEKYLINANINIVNPEVAHGENLQRWQEWDIIYQRTEDGIKYYSFRNLNSGLLLQAANEEGEKVIQNRKSSTNVDAQLWALEESAESEEYEIINKANGFYLTLNSSGSITYVTQQTGDNSDRQRWVINKLPRDSYRDDDVCNFFNRTTGSVAFDQGNSIPLSDGRVLWVTQDAWFEGSLAPNGNLNGNHFISYSNSVIIQSAMDNWSPNAVMMTADGRSNGGVGNLIPKYPGKTWSWPGAGVELNNIVYIHNTEGEGLGTDNDHQSLYKLTPITNTHWKTERTTPAGLTASEKLMRFASGMVKANDGYVYVYGSRNIPDSFGFNTYLYVARFLQNDPQNWTFWNGNAWVATASLSSSAHVSTGNGTNYVSYLNGKYIHLTMDQGFYCDIPSINMYISTSSSPTGPFTTKKLVHSFTEYYKGKNARVYTPLIHTSSVNGKDELLITYSINFGACVVNNDGAIKESDGTYDSYYYRVKGVRIPYSLFE
ncbi:RICIN domain-containing protein [Sphingobacterium hungaricum]